ncbi:unnamed protein product, partial [Citrullus colocynthis]
MITLYEYLAVAAKRGRLQEARSCCLNNSCATAAEEITTVGTEPNLRSVMGPCVFERFHKERWG